MFANCTDNCGDVCPNVDVGYAGWEAPGIGRPLIFMSVQGLVCLFILYLLESDSFQRAVRTLSGERRAGDHRQQQQQQRQPGDMEMMTVGGVRGPVTMQAPIEDSDVAAERQRIISTPGIVNYG